ncbi:MAG: hypothetical protein ACT4TC_12215, partial [Myxococcaceae bacterium]
MRVFFTLCVVISSTAWAEAQQDRFNAGGYFRIMTRPDFQGGSSRLGYSNLYGRLLNEGPYGALELKLNVLNAAPGSSEVWASVHTKIEGGSISNADALNGTLSAFRVSQLYVKAGNILFDHVTWQLGTLDTWFGDLGLYDMKPAQIFFETMGLSARYNLENLELLVGVGDSGYFVKGPRYNTMFTGGGTLRLRLGNHFELGGGGAYYFEPHVDGNQFSPYTTQNVRYEDYVRREVVQRYFEQTPTATRDFLPPPGSSNAQSFKLVGYLGFGKLGPIKWNNFFVNFMRMHPDGPYQ